MGTLFFKLTESPYINFAKSSTVYNINGHGPMD